MVHSQERPGRCWFAVGAAAIVTAVSASSAIGAPPAEVGNHGHVPHGVEVVEEVVPHVLTGRRTRSQGGAGSSQNGGTPAASRPRRRGSTGSNGSARARRTQTRRRPNSARVSGGVQAQPLLAASGGTEAPRIEVRGRSSDAPETRRRGARRRGRSDSSRRRLATAARPAAVPTSAPASRDSSEKRANRRSARGADKPADPGVRATLNDIVEVVPPSLRLALIALVIISVALALNAIRGASRSRRLGRQREDLLADVGALQAALLPAIPAQLGDLFASAAYRSADGPAGGDFYDAFCFDNGRVGIIVGDVSGHGREALASTARLRYTLRTCLEMQLEPRAALQAAAATIGEELEDDLATVVLAVYEPDTHELTYATAGHPKPIVLGPAAHEPLTICSSPPIGSGLPTGLRQTTFVLDEASTVCFYTDGATDVRVAGEFLGREGLSRMVASLGDAGSAERLMEQLAAVAERIPDDIALCMIGGTARIETGSRLEELDLSPDDVTYGLADRFIRACGVPETEIAPMISAASDEAGEHGHAVLRVHISESGAHAEVATEPELGAQALVAPLA